MSAISLRLHGVKDITKESSEMDNNQAAYTSHTKILTAETTELA